MDSEEFKDSHPLVVEIERRGIKLIQTPEGYKCRCPFHEDKNPSMTVNVAKRVFHCHGCRATGSVIDFIMLSEGKTLQEVLSSGETSPRPISAPKRPTVEAVNEPAVQHKVDKRYAYTDELGNFAYEVVRYIPKTFRQRRWIDGKWVYSMEGAQRYLYKLPLVLKASEVWIVEGEKDADNLHTVGLCGTCNAMGAEKWLDGYSDSLKGKKVVICGDNDAAGKKHVNKVFESLAGKAAEVRIVELPKEFKDVSDWLAAQTAGPEESKRLLMEMRDAAAPFFKGVKMPLIKFADIEERYAAQAKKSHENGIDLGDWLPSLKGVVRKLIPGDLVVVLGGTGVGKTTILSNMLNTFRKRPTIFFEMELTPELLFERLMAMRNKQSAQAIEKVYASGEKAGWDVCDKTFPNLYICTEIKLTVDRIEEIANTAELVMGVRPEVLFIDYIGLLDNSGSSRYEALSKAAEDLRRAANKTKMVLIVSSQIGRKKNEDSPEVNLYDGKDSGSLENSASLLFGAWRDTENANILRLKVLKQTKGSSGFEVACNFNGETMTITEMGRSY